MLLAHFQLLLLQSFILSTFDCRSRTDFTSGPHLHESTQGTDLLKLVPKVGEGHWHKCPGQGVQPRQLEKSGGNKEKNSTSGLDYLQIVQFHLGCNCQIDMRKAVSPLNSLKSTHDANFPRIYGSSPLEVIISACGGRGVLAEISQSLMSQSWSQRDRIVQQLDFGGNHRIAPQQRCQYRVVSVPDKSLPQTSQHQESQHGNLVGHIPPHCQTLHSSHHWPSLLLPSFRGHRQHLPHPVQLRHENKIAQQLAALVDFPTHVQKRRGMQTGPIKIQLVFELRIR